MFSKTPGMADQSFDASVNRTISSTRAVIDAVAARHGLYVNYDYTAPVELCGNIPRQRGLDFGLAVVVQNNDEIWISGSFFTMSWLPAQEPGLLEEVKQTLNGIISGQIRYLCKFGPLAQKPYTVEIQRQFGSEWTLHSKYSTLCDIPWETGRMTVRNGFAAELIGRAKHLPQLD